jgi:hypothetical protein
MQFDEKVHLFSIGGGFLRTPYLAATVDGANYDSPENCAAIQPQIIHIPSAGRKSGLNLETPTFSKAIFTSALCKRLTTDMAAQVNQESAGITFGFHAEPDRNICRARLSEGIRDPSGRLLFLDEPPANFPRPIDLASATTDDMSTGFLVFISRYWQDLRHVDQNLLMKHLVPLQFDCDFDIIPMLNENCIVNLPIIGNVGAVIAYDAEQGIDSYNPSGSDVGGVATVTVYADGIGGYYMTLSVTASQPTALSIAIKDASGQVFVRNIVVQDGYPPGAVVKMPHGVVGVPYLCSLECSNVCDNQEQCDSVYPSFDPDDLILPAGLTYNQRLSRVEGTPTEYGTNFGLHPSAITSEGEQALGISLTVNRPHRNLMTLVDSEINDHATGEYYSVHFMPFGSVLTYGGDTYEFKRFLSNLQPWPGMKKIPYTYGATNRPSVKQQEAVWRAVPSG